MLHIWKWPKCFFGILYNWILLVKVWIYGSHMIRKPGRLPQLDVSDIILLDIRDKYQ